MSLLEQLSPDVLGIILEFLLGDPLSLSRLSGVSKTLVHRSSRFFTRMLRTHFKDEIECMPGNERRTFLLRLIERDRRVVLPGGVLRRFGSFAAFSDRSGVMTVADSRPVKYFEGDTLCDFVSSETMWPRNDDDESEETVPFYLDDALQLGAMLRKGGHVMLDDELVALLAKLLPEVKNWES